ncbi:uncharacterized protein LOC129610774 [Condylostylus longicornis]|uniref:uncharacterized protein LOC129610774 n=1 Tax=Condylostylus longicornis TaxID=2530218 RepID=UPI00244DD899|nr:uncharacterized protein LOC129610774 [Condylostylus longicornis]
MIIYNTSAPQENVINNRTTAEITTTTKQNQKGVSSLSSSSLTKKIYNNSKNLSNLNVLPSESYLHIEGSLTKSTGEKSDKIKFVNNGVCHLFEEIRYLLNGIEIDSTKKLGHTATLKNYISLSNNKNDMLKNAGWSPSETFITPTGFFDFCIPLKFLLGFAEDYKKILVNCKHELVLVRSRTDENVYLVTDETEKPLINIFKITWIVPHIITSDENKLPLLKIVDNARPLSISFRSWEIYEYPKLAETTHHIWSVKTSSQLEKPRYIVFVHLNAETYPYENLNISFDKDKYSILYHMYANFQTSYYQAIENSPVISRDHFKSKIGPIVVVDCTHQNESLKSGAVDVRLEFKTSINVPASTSAYCLLIHDRVVQYNPLTSEVRKIN